MDDQQKMTFILWTGDFTRVFADFIHRQCFELSWELWMRTYVTYFKSSWFAKPQSTAPMGLFRWWMLQDSQRLGPWWCQRPAARCDQKASEMMKWLWLSYLSWTWRNPNILSFHEVWWNFQIFPVLYHLKITWKSIPVEKLSDFSGDLSGIFFPVLYRPWLANWVAFFRPWPGARRRLHVYDQHHVGKLGFFFCDWWFATFFFHMAVCQNLVPLVNIRIAGKWMFIP